MKYWRASISSAVAIGVFLARGVVFAATPSSESCDYYLDAEKQRACSENPVSKSSYLVDYGYRYCRKFKAAEVGWDSELQQWSAKTRLCLQEMLDGNPKRITPCAQMQSFAFDSHAICYKQYGFCNLKRVNIARVAGLLQAEDVVSADSVAQIINVSIGCNLFLSASEKVFFERIRTGVRNQSAVVRNFAASLFAGAPVGEQRSGYFNDALAHLLSGKQYASQATLVDAYVADAQQAIVRGEKLAVLNTCWHSNASDDHALRCPNIHIAVQAKGLPRMVSRDILLYEDIEQIRSALSLKYGITP